MYKNQKEIVLDYLETNGTITTFECYSKLEIVDLQKAINLLRKEGYSISDRWISKINHRGRRIKYKEYKLEEEKWKVQ